MIADGPGNCLTPEQHAHLALLGQASGIAQLDAIGTWSVQVGKKKSRVAQAEIHVEGGNSAFREVECSLRETSLHAIEPPGAVMRLRLAT
jgi:hypothetical protein